MNLMEPGEGGARRRFRPGVQRRGRIVRFSSLRRGSRDVLHALFEACADERRSTVAVASGRRVRSYGELERHANQIARHLLARGTRRGSRVGVLLRRSFDAYAAILGILKAGAAYVPLDPHDLPGRREGLLSDAGAAALVTTTEFAGDHGSFAGTIVALDSCRTEISAESTTRLSGRATHVGPDDLCYVMYTPDATGRARGVMVEHQSACHHVRATGTVLGVRPWDRIYQGALLSSDGSFLEIWLAFQVGAALVAPASGARGGRRLARLLSRSRATVLSCAPSVLATLPADVPAIRLLILGGGNIPDELVTRWTRADRRIVNTYGRTEIGVTTYADLLPGNPVTIGRPVPGCRVYVLDERLRLTRCGTVGEICVSGDGVARGYLGLPSETDARFVTDPFVPGARLYRTADLGRIDPTGNLEFHGSAGDPVKEWSKEGSRS